MQLLRKNSNKSFILASFISKCDVPCHIFDNNSEITTLDLDYESENDSIAATANLNVIYSLEEELRHLQT